MPFGLQQCLSRFRRDQRGNIAVIFTIAAIPLISAIGCAVDYSMATRMKAKLQSAADAAGIAALSQKSPGFLAASTMTGNGSVTAGVTDANNVFDANMSGITGYQNLVRSSTVTKTGIKLDAKVEYTADVPVTFMKVVGFQKLTVTGFSSSAASLPPYLDFYLTLDVSGSMGLASTSAEQTRLAQVNPDNYRQYPTGCAFACHFAPQNSACTNTGTQGYPTNNYCLGYKISRVSQSGYTSLLMTNNTYPKQQQLPTGIVSGLPNSLYAPKNPGPKSGLTGGGLTAVSNCKTAGTDDCIQLRLDAVGYALTELFKTANESKKVPDQFKIGLYPFIRYLYAYFPLTKNINGNPETPGTINYAAANLATLLDTNVNTNLGSGGTHISAALTSVNSLISGGTGAVGDGSTPTTPQPYVFLITDGAQNNQVKGVPNGSWSGSNHATTIDLQNTLTTVPSCEALKGRGIKVSVLYIPYEKIDPVNTSFAGNEGTYANNNIQYIPASLRKCASSADFFRTASTPQEIQAALDAMFKHALRTAHITH
ncbi:TadE/TadG family type IV pilus assembly protein [Bradyrhizobium valentinum]|uniref:Pilus assembly protein TadG n=1 Tax=Bradyrhizobium valentinum TaxID=1518501 RepID=A0A0R3KL58_9BRAD|nr:TadE/TadG family type IV pilus assembly protein [Bradyrhizobium valentinum]KRQ93474.1 pilus assembly protein TadG [Bradyrhizobium valentinum]KRR02407.1 pilus assembly protein TadG [Bradyrhizobium valentinum]